MAGIPLKFKARRRMRICAIVAATGVAVLGCSSGGEDESSEGGGIDEDVQAAYDEFASSELPGITPELIQAAKDEGSVTYYTGFFGEGNIDGFKERFPFIRVESITLTAGPLAERFMGEKRSGVNEADLYTAPEGGVLPAIDEGFCEEYTPTSDDRYADEYKVPGVAYRWGGGYYSIAFVPERLQPGDAEALTQWTGLADERFEGRVQGVSKNPPGSGTHYAWSSLYKAVGPELLEEHAALGPIRVYAGTTEETSALLLGEIDFATMITLSGPSEVYFAGAPIGWVTPEPLIVAPWSGCIATEAPHPNAAKLMWEYILSDEGQLSMLPANHSYKTDLDISAGLPEELLEEEWFTLPDLTNLATLSQEEDAAMTDEVEAFWNRVYLGQ